jgi:hypothetical protein
MNNLMASVTTPQVIERVVQEGPASSYEKVVEAAEAEPEKFGDVKERMDRTGYVERFKKKNARPSGEDRAPREGRVDRDGSKRPQPSARGTKKGRNPVGGRGLGTLACSWDGHLPTAVLPSDSLGFPVTLAGSQAVS